MSLLRFLLPLRRFQWCRRRLGGLWQRWQFADHFEEMRFLSSSWWWFENEAAAQMHFDWHRRRARSLLVVDVEDYRLTRIDISHVPEQP